ncbi:DUF5392 family protein [Bacillus sp. V5-8f]|nr:DUF5392 family protein [Bacillus sp. V5-8f]
MNVLMNDIPHYIKKEMEQLQTVISPLMKKVVKEVRFEA